MEQNKTKDFLEFLSLQYKDLYLATSGMFKLSYDYDVNRYIAVAYHTLGRGFQSVIFDNVDYNVVRDKCVEYDKNHAKTFRFGMLCYIDKLYNYEK